jgi:Protein of unknown function (DUF3450)
LIFFAALSVLAAVGGTDTRDMQAPASATESKMVIEKLKQDIALEEKAWAEETAREKTAEARRRQRHEEFTRDRLEMQKAIAGQEERITDLTAKLESLGLKEKEMQAHFQALNQVVAKESQVLMDSMAFEIPYRLEKRRETLALLNRDIEAGQISSEEALNRIWTFIQNERRLAQEAEVYSGDLLLDGTPDPIQVKYLRLGKQILAYASLDGTRLGVLKGIPSDSLKVAYEWMREDKMDHQTRKAIKDALATAEGISVPGFVPIPIWRAALGEVKP